MSNWEVVFAGRGNRRKAVYYMTSATGYQDTSKMQRDCNRLRRKRKMGSGYEVYTITKSMGKPTKVMTKTGL